MTRPAPARPAAPPRGAALLCGTALLCGAALLAAGCDRGTAPPAAAEPAAAPAAGFPAGPYFEDATDELGVAFTRFEGRDPGPGGVIATGRRMFEWQGGGVAAFDYDADGRPDLFFPQGRAWPGGDTPPPPDDSADPAYRDTLYRNVDGAAFAEVSAAAGVPAGAFGVAAAAGDYDGDGFADLYVCEIGGNRLLRNEGDGTFADVTAAAGVPAAGPAGGGPGEPGLSLTVAIADLSGDGLPDLYDSNYVRARDLYTRVCGTPPEPPRACGPEEFSAAPDRFLLNLGNGTFADVSEAAGLPDGPGRARPSFGVLAADLDGAAGLELFVAVDARPNQLLVRRDHDANVPNANVPQDGGTGGPAAPRFGELGRLAGLATAGPRLIDVFACMGVACADVDGDRRPDLFVTNFADEPNTLYRNWSSPGRPSFEDGTAAAGLADPGRETLAFGTQFLDADRDGDPDLAYVNGHLDDYAHRGKAFFMKPALLRNDGGRFTQIPAETAGPFFARPDLGRGLARLDWDGDGRDELAVSHLGRRAAVLRNVFDGGSGVGLRVTDPAGDRDAVGAVVTVTAPTGPDGAPRGPRAMFVTAGDGFAASNERVLNFGLGATPDDAEVIASVRWPDGTEEAIAGVTAGGRFLLTRGRGEAVAVR